jgi:hypothetical protein
MGRRKWKGMMADLQQRVRKAKRVDGLSSTEYEERIQELTAFLHSIVNVVEHRGKKWPPRWPRLSKNVARAASASD